MSFYTYILYNNIIGFLFFALVLFAAVTSAIALTESAVSTFSDEFGWSRRNGTLFMAFIMILLGSLSSLGNGPPAYGYSAREGEHHADAQGPGTPELCPHQD